MSLPSFERPPVREVVVAVRFRRLDVSTADFVRWADRTFGDELPHFQELQPIEMPIEPTADDGLIGRSFQLNLTPHRQSRLWFRSVDGTQLVQVQPDWMAVNWESAQNGLGYPRFAAIEELFVRVFDSLTSVSHDPLIPIQVEVTYVNHIGSESDLTNHSQAPELFRLAGELPVPLGLADRTQAEASFAIPFGDTAPYGKLHVSLVPGLKDDGQTPIYSLTLTARGKPVTADKEGVLRFVEVGHEAIVRGFASATTERAHQIWGRHE